jgi:hypothetical protein
MADTGISGETAAPEEINREQPDGGQAQDVAAEPLFNALADGSEDPLAVPMALPDQADDDDDDDYDDADDDDLAGDGPEDDEDADDEDEDEEDETDPDPDGDRDRSDDRENPAP